MTAPTKWQRASQRASEGGILPPTATVKFCANRCRSPNFDSIPERNRLKLD